MTQQSPPLPPDLDAVQNALDAWIAADCPDNPIPPQCISPLETARRRGRHIFRHGLAVKSVFMALGSRLKSEQVQSWVATPLEDGAWEVWLTLSPTHGISARYSPSEDRVLALDGTEGRKRPLPVSILSRLQICHAAATVQAPVDRDIERHPVIMGPKLIDNLPHVEVMLIGVIQDGVPINGHVSVLAPEGKSQAFWATQGELEIVPTPQKGGYITIPRGGAEQPLDVDVYTSLRYGLKIIVLTELGIWRVVNETIAYCPWPA